MLWMNTEQVYNFLSRNGKYPIELPKDLTSLGQETLLILCDDFTYFYNAQYDMALSARKSNDPEYRKYEEREAAFLRTKNDLYEAAKTATHSVIMPVRYEANEELDFSSLVMSPSELCYYDIYLLGGENGLECIIEPCFQFGRRCYLKCVAREGLFNLAFNETLRKLWFALAFRNSSVLRKHCKSFSRETVQQVIEKALKGFCV